MGVVDRWTFLNLVFIVEVDRRTSLPAGLKDSQMSMKTYVAIVACEGGEVGLDMSWFPFLRDLVLFLPTILRFRDFKYAYA